MGFDGGGVGDIIQNQTSPYFGFQEVGISLYRNRRHDEIVRSPDDSPKGTKVRVTLETRIQR